MKNGLFKKSMSVFLAVLMLMSCWVFVPGEHHLHAEAASESATALINKAALDGINTSVDTSTTTTHYKFKIYGSGDDDGSHNTTRQNKYYINVLSHNLSNGYLTSANTGSYFSDVTNAQSEVSVMYPTMVLKYDGNQNPRFGIMLQGDSANKKTIRFEQVYMDSGSGGLEFSPYKYWKGIASNNSCFYYLMEVVGGKEATYKLHAQDTTSGGGVFNARSGGQWEFLAASLEFTGDMSMGEWVRSISPVWKFRGGATSNPDTYTGTNTSTIYVMNFKGYSELLSQINTKKTELIDNAGIYTPASIQNFVNAAKKITGLNPKDYTSTSNVTSWGSQMTTAYSDYTAAVNGLTKRTFDLTYENLFSFSDFINSESTELDGGGASVSGSSIKYDNNAGTITATTGGGEVYTKSNAGGKLYSVPVKAGTEYKLDYDAEYKGSIQTFVFFYNDNGQPVSVPDSTNNFYNDYAGKAITFKVPAGATRVGFRFGTYGSSGNYAKYSNIRLYETSRQDIVDCTKAQGINRVVYNAGDLIQTNTIPSITRTGYTFDGWFVKDVDNTHDGNWDSLTDYVVGGSRQYNMAASFVIYSEWTANTYTVTWKFADKDNTIQTETYSYGAIPTAPANKTAYNDAAGHHTFAWDPAIGAVTGDVTYTEKETKVDHTVVTDAAVAATCTAPGKTEGSHCSVCNVVLVAQKEIPANGHTFKETAAKDATCTADGNIDYWTCEGCGKIYSDAEAKREITAAQTVVKAKGHNFGAWAPAGDGTHKRECTVCTNETGRVETENCSYGNWTEHDAAKHRKYCECGNYKEEKHNFGEWTVVDGTQTRSCSVCGYTETEKVYTVTWKNGDGNVIEIDTNVPVGTVPTYDGETPTKTATAEYTYTFNGNWDPEISAVTGNATYTAQFDSTPKTYAVTWIVDDVETKVEYAYGATVEAPAAPTKTGYTFAGWDVEIPTTMPAGDMTITAQWTVNQYTITFDTAGGTEIAPITQDYGTAITAPADPTKEGYTFAGWDKAVPATMPAENVTIKAKWTINKYTITFDTDGGTEIAPITQDYNTAITAPADPTKEGYTFDGWDAEIPATMPAEDVTITAKWKINQYTITFDTDGGSAVDAITQDYGTAITAPAAPTKEGYTFAGWDKKVPTTMPAENVTITAQWKINQYTITFNTDGGSAVAPITQDYNTAITAPADPIKTGYTFAGWDAEIPATMPAGDMTITAQWTVNQYTISFDTDGGTAVDAITQDYGTAVTVPAAPTKTGYTFTGWDKAVPTTMPAENVTIKANWTVNKYTITWKNDDGSVIDTTTVEYGVVPTHADATKTATAQYTYTFAGWFPGVVAVTGDATYTAQFDSTVNKYTVKFVDENKTELQSETLDYGTPVNYPSKPSKAYDDKNHYTFAGWKKADGTVINPDTTSLTVSEDATYTATYTATAHSYDEYKQNSDKESHTGTCECGKTVTGDCSGGKADCLDAAVCSTCNTAYGDALGHDYDTTKSELNLTRPVYNETTGEWSQGYYTYTCGNDPSHTTEDYVERASYDEYNAAVKNLNDLLATDITDEARAAIEAALEANKVADNLISTEEETVLDPKTNALVEIFNKYADDLKTYTVTFVVEGTAVSTQTVISGKDATAPSETPTKAKDDTYHYTFKEWDTEFTNVTSDLIVTATFNAVAHVYGNKFVEHKASCTETGNYRQNCTGCEHYVTEQIPTRDHNLVDTTVAKAATCTETGTMNQKCDRTASAEYEACDYTTTSVIPVDADAHDWNEGVVTTPATCTTEGEKTFTCKHDGSHTKTEVVAIVADAHDWNEGVVTTPATCTTEGEKTFTCKHDGSHTKTEAVAIVADAHSYGEWTQTKAPTCSVVGTEERVCAHNASHKETREVAINPTAHTYTSVVTAPTCDLQGYTTHTCSGCGDTKVDTYVDALGHKYNVTDHKDASCTAEGYDEYTCENDATHTYTEVLGKLAHTEEILPGKAATCKDDGLTEGKKCSVCGTVTVSQQTIPATGEHKEISIGDVPATCVSTGSKGKVVCEICGTTISEDEVIPKTDHQYGAAPVHVIPATCIKGKVSVYKCKFCDERKEVADPANQKAPHTIVEVCVVEATCEFSGVYSYYCTTCSETVKSETIPALGHTDKNGDELCDNCNGKYVDPDNNKVCGCICHKEGAFMKFIYKIVRFFWKLFKISKTCSCGAVHY